MVCSGKLKKDVLLTFDLLRAAVCGVCVCVRAETRGRTCILVALCPISMRQGLLLKLGLRPAVLSPPLTVPGLQTQLAFYVSAGDLNSGLCGYRPLSAEPP